MTRGWAFSIRPNDGDLAADQLRIGDAERESAANALGEHISAGRLTWDEYDSRLQTVYAAKTRGELRPLFRDLPALAAVAPPKPGLGARFADSVGVPLRLVALFLVLFAALTVAHLAGSRGPGWVIVPLLFFWFGPLRHRHHHNHPRRRGAVPVSASPWEPPRGR